MRPAVEIVEAFLAGRRGHDASTLAPDVEFIPISRERAYGPEGLERSLGDIAEQFRDYDVWPAELLPHGKGVVIALMRRRGLTHRGDVPIEDRFVQVFTIEDERITRIESFKTLEEARSTLR
jgi:ketosteroid isomerase-like protein